MAAPTRWVTSRTLQRFCARTWLFLGSLSFDCRVSQFWLIWVAFGLPFSVESFVLLLKYFDRVLVSWRRCFPLLWILLPNHQLSLMGPAGNIFLFTILLVLIKFMWKSKHFDLDLVLFIVYFLFVFSLSFLSLVEGFIYLTRAHTRNAPGLLETVRYFLDLCCENDRIPSWWSWNVFFFMITGDRFSKIVFESDVWSFFICDPFLKTSCCYGKQGLQEKIKLVPIDLQNRPAWYKEKVYPPNKVRCFYIIVFYDTYVQ